VGLLSPSCELQDNITLNECMTGSFPNPFQSITPFSQPVV